MAGNWSVNSRRCGYDRGEVTAVLGRVLAAVVVGAPKAAAARVKFCINAGSEVWKLVRLKNVI